MNGDDKKMPCKHLQCNLQHTVTGKPAMQCKLTKCNGNGRSDDDDCDGLCCFSARREFSSGQSHKKVQ